MRVVPPPPFFTNNKKRGGRCLVLDADGTFESCELLLTELANEFNATFSKHMEAGPMRRDFLKWCAFAGLGLAGTTCLPRTVGAERSQELPAYEGLARCLF